MKDHEIRDLVNTLTAIGKAYGETQQLRQRIHEAVVPKIEALRSEKKMYQATANALEGAVCMCTHFTGDPPYVGDEGLVLAIEEQADELKAYRAGAKSKSQVKRIMAQMKEDTD